MGIKDLTAFLKEYAPDSISKGNLNTLGKQFGTQNRKARAAIDTSLFMYKYKYRSGDDFINEFLEQINRLLVNNIEPIYVFDGAPPLEKKQTIDNRKERQVAMLEKINDLNQTLKNLNQEINNLSEDSDEKNSKLEQQKKLVFEIAKTKRKSVHVSSSDINKLKYFLDIMNIKYIKRNSEADLVSSKLSELGIVDFVISEDMDHLTSGTSILLRDFNNRNNNVTVYNSKIACNITELSYEKWIELCIFFGCDYVNRIKGMGYKTSYKIIKKNSNLPIEDIIKQIQLQGKFKLEENYTDKVIKAKTIFHNNNDFELDNIVSDPKKDVFDNQISIIKNYLEKYTKFSEQKIKNRIKNIYGYCI